MAACLLASMMDAADQSLCTAQVVGNKPDKLQLNYPRKGVSCKMRSIYTSVATYASVLSTQTEAWLQMALWQASQRARRTGNGSTHFFLRYRSFSIRFVHLSVLIGSGTNTAAVKLTVAGRSPERRRPQIQSATADTGMLENRTSKQPVTLKKKLQARAATSSLCTASS